MPQFDSIEEWEEKVNTIEILEWICINKGFNCTTGESYCPLMKDKS
jgi:hypothetical protein